MKLRPLYVLLAIIYMVLTPTCATVEHGSNNRTKIENIKTYLDIWFFGSDLSFGYYGLFATYKHQVDNNLRFVIDDQSKSIDTFTIISIVATIDGQEFPVTSPDQPLVLDRKNDKIRGTAHYEFSVPKVPNEQIMIEIVGVANNLDGKSTKVNETITKSVDANKFTLPLFMFFHGFLTQT